MELELNDAHCGKHFMAINKNSRSGAFSLYLSV
jgi:hypothetical protein